MSPRVRVRPIPSPAVIRYPRTLSQTHRLQLEDRVTHSLRRLALAVVLLGGLFTPSLALVTPAPHLDAAQDPKSITVYVTRTGEKYHRDGCRYLRQSRIPMSLSEASKRFDPCSVCKPPRA
jgi:hypothetical protein